MSKEVIERQLDITPFTYSLIAAHNMRLGWKKCIAELVDNSLDAGANSIDVLFGKKSLVISDDGRGIADLECAFRLGHHVEQSTTSLGMYGVGLKDAALWLWGETTVSTSRSGKIRKASVRWDKICKSGEWKVACFEYDSTPEDCASLGVPQKHGTTISFTSIKRQFSERDAIIKELGYAFAPAIKKGRNIVISHGRTSYPVAAFEPPPLEHAIDIEREVNGKKYRLRAGVVPEGIPNEKRGFTLAFGHRVLTNTCEGCGSFGADRFFGWVDLDSTWRPSRNKDELVEDAEALSESLQYECLEQLRLASDQARCFALSGIESAVQNALQGAMEASGKKKAKRNTRANETGAVEPKQTGRVHRRASKTQNGLGSIVSRVGGKIALRLIRGLGADTVGRTEINSEAIGVSLSLDHPCVKLAAETNNNLTLLVLAASVLAIHGATTLNERERQKLMKFEHSEREHDNFLKGLAVYVSHIDTEESVVASEIPCGNRSESSAVVV